jgi:MYXO-CTERM domain-containing protein
LSLDQAPRSPFRNPDGSFTEQAERGRKVFERAGCPRCHAAPTFTNSDGGELFDVGTLLPTSGHRLGGDLLGLDTPTLKGVWQSAPYLHDGRAATLRDVFTIAGDAMGKVSTLSAQELDELVRYLQELDDVTEPPPRVVPKDDAKAGGCTMTPAKPRSGALLLLVLASIARRFRRRSSEA